MCDAWRKRGSGDARRVVVGLDQAAASGWGIAYERGRVVEHGCARKHGARLAVVGRAIELASGDAKRVHVWFEKHDHMPLDRLGRNDHTTARKSGRFGAVERGPAQVHGMGKSYGRWLELLDLAGIPEANRHEVRPSTWRARVHGVTRGDQIKQAAIAWASMHVGWQLTDDNHAEGVCITAWAALDGLAGADAERTHARAEAKGKREVSRQRALFEGGE